jgi:hypothetical protein
VAFLDDDDAWLPGKLRAQLAAVADAVADAAAAAGAAAADLAAAQAHTAAVAASIVMVCGTAAEDHAASSAGGRDGSGAPRATMPRGWEALPPLLGPEHLSPGASGGGAAETDGSGGRCGGAAAGNPVVTSTVLVRKAAMDAVGGFGPQKYGQDLDCWRRCLQPASAAGGEGGGSLLLGGSGRRLCVFVRRCLAVYGTGGLDRSTVAKETRQAVRAAVANHGASHGGNVGGGGGRAAAVAVAPGDGGGGLPASLINGFLGI